MAAAGRAFCRAWRSPAAAAEQWHTSCWLGVNTNARAVRGSAVPGVGRVCHCSTGAAQCVGAGPRIPCRQRASSADAAGIRTSWAALLGRCRQGVFRSFKLPGGSGRAVAHLSGTRSQHNASALRGLLASPPLSLHIAPATRGPGGSRCPPGHRRRFLVARPWGRSRCSRSSSRRRR